ncbi:UDP-glycosyltransferase UGT5-like isoform X5 [Planococcus citri]|uniref:UDP-glycosyltransferase UGT5-like isoform X5 n=1 Tax=Planococcus citri TaxID=170843 RepID=UPI0031F831F8
MLLVQFRFIFGFTFLVQLLKCISAHRILAVSPFISYSHFKTMEPILLELANRGHQVTVISNYPQKTPVPNYLDIDFTACNKVLFANVSITTHPTESSAVRLIFMLSTLHKSITSAECYLKVESFQKLLRSNQTFDLVMSEYYHSQLYDTLGLVFGTPVMHVISVPMIPPWVSSYYGNPQNPSYIRHFLSNVDQRMSFFERVQNTIELAVMLLADKLFYSRITREFAYRYFGSSIPSTGEWTRTASLALVNSHHSVSGVRPLVPNVIEIGGIHIKQAAVLPENIEKFINESKHGVVYFCMGSLLRGETFPPEKREAFLYAFSKIPQRVLWKWEGDVLPGKSDNIMISKWMPQRDILAHPNVKLFISHGGLLGTSEAVYEGVPVLGIPIFGDQRTNIKSLEANGAGELLDYNEISKEVVLEKIQRLLNDPKYKENAKLLSDRYRDRPMSPLDTAVYWTEYVIRHKGAPHLRTAAADMPWYQYLLLDVIAFIVAVLVAGLLIIYYTTKFILRAIYGLICGGGAKKGSSKSDKKKRN